MPQSNPHAVRLLGPNDIPKTVDKPSFTQGALNVLLDSLPHRVLQRNYQNLVSVETPRSQTIRAETPRERLKTALSGMFSLTGNSEGNALGRKILSDAGAFGLMGTPGGPLSAMGAGAIGAVMGAGRYLYPDMDREINAIERSGLASFGPLGVVSVKGQPVAGAAADDMIMEYYSTILPQLARRRNQTRGLVDDADLIGDAALAIQERLTEPKVYDFASIEEAKKHLTNLAQHKIHGEIVEGIDTFKHEIKPTAKLETGGTMEEGIEAARHQAQGGVRPAQAKTEGAETKYDLRSQIPDPVNRHIFENRFGTTEPESLRQLAKDLGMASDNAIRARIESDPVLNAARSVIGTNIDQTKGAWEALKEAIKLGKQSDDAIKAAARSARRDIMRQYNRDDVFNSILTLAQEKQDLARAFFMRGEKPHRLQRDFGDAAKPANLRDLALEMYTKLKSK
jgi:hypothetical protein